MKRSQYGFTVIEVLVVILFLGLATTVLMIQRANLSATQRDSDRKTAINAIYYNLEEVFYAKNGYYPTKVESSILPAMDPELFKDPLGHSINEAESSYRYEGKNCNDNKCKSYTLRTSLEKEADFIKTNRTRS